MKINEKKEPVHEPVLVNEVLEAFGLNIAHLKSQAKYIDATVGAAGHSKEMVKKGACVLGIDQDLEMLKFAEEVLEQACPTPNQNGLGSFKLLHGNFRNIDQIAQDNGFSHVDGILFDLGVSSHHFDDKKRGFSFSDSDAVLDMRLDPQTMGVTAADLLNSLPKDKLFALFESTLDYKEARRLSEQVVQKRSEHRIATVGDFAEIVKISIVNKNKAFSKTVDINTIPFMALRIAVNSELENLKEALPKCFNLLKQKGRLAVISFHSNEDRIVKDYSKEIFDKKIAKIITKKPIIPTKTEVERNPKSRSAKMRVFQKL